MKTSTKIFLFLFVGAIGALVYFALPVFKQRYFQNGTPPSAERQRDNKIKIENTPESEKEKTDEIEISNDSQPKSNEYSPETEGESFTEVSRDKCETGCVSFEEDKEYFEYCQQACGLSPAPTQPGGNCEDLQGLKKDYCLKDLGIKEEDFSVCEKIEDTNIRTTCTARVTEDLLEKIPNQ
ncbi:MAG: hypothetical protein UY41_C0042G0002 [Candidatus Moranbacteria bacterium GW2011_GWE1_49_15]|nr:MAG: hypothetical protein UY41_C0042G0002 [Candidatus Moranbacteria bacterium GW2011_GWE1_49_15]HBP01253.1 hypothetical protein [Candidatus Moranbacteria bacterium]